MKMNDTINITNSEYRPCYVDGRKALFHRWKDKESIVLKFNIITNYHERTKVLREYYESKIVPSMCDIVKIKNVLGIVELEDGTIDEVEPTSIRFIDNKMIDYVFDDEVEK